MVARYSISFGWRDVLRALGGRRLARDAGCGPIWRHLGFDEHEAAWTINGRTALRVLLRAAGIHRGESIVVPRLTCEQVHRALVSEGARLCFVDIRAGEFAPTAADYAAAQADCGARFVVVISYWGIPPDVAALRAALPDTVRIIQDCALSFGSWRDGVQDGVSGDAAFFSFGPGKPLILGLGGCLLWRRSAFPELERNRPETLLSPCPRRLAWRALLGTWLKAQVFRRGWAYQLARTLPGCDAEATRTLTLDSSPLLSAPGWLEGAFEAKRRLAQAVARQRNERRERLRDLLADCVCRFPAAEGSSFWNSWLSPFLLPEHTQAADVVAHLARLGFEARSPYTEELTDEASRELDSNRLPNWLVTPSLDLLEDGRLGRFAAALKTALKDEH